MQPKQGTEITRFLWHVKLSLFALQARDFGAGFAGLRQTDRDRLLAALYFFTALAAFEFAFFPLVHYALYFFLCFGTVFRHEKLRLFDTDISITPAE